MATEREPLTGSFEFRLPPEWGIDSAQTNRLHLGLRGGGKADAQIVSVCCPGLQVEIENRELNRQIPSMSYSSWLQCAWNLTEVIIRREMERILHGRIGRE